jgi:hypothetical protein
MSILIQMPRKQAAVPDDDIAQSGPLPAVHKKAGPAGPAEVVSKL